MDYTEIKKLMDDMGESKIDCLDIEFPEGVKISMKKNQIVANQLPTDNIVPSQICINNTKLEPVNEESKIDENIKIIKSPMVGTFYNRPSPKENPFVKVGDKVSKGDSLCVIEAMKLMNEIESEFDGEIIEVCVENEATVEYGMPLFKIK